ncbi:hypothetical protein KJ693_05690 [bacterium]|nr:hypothetical protein [bacterium]MBU1614791.1 hypothetical protein [bacterium]
MGSILTLSLTSVLPPVGLVLTIFTTGLLSSSWGLLSLMMIDDLASGSGRGSLLVGPDFFSSFSLTASLPWLRLASVRPPNWVSVQPSTRACSPPSSIISR